MSAATVDYFFTLISPYTYLGHRSFVALAGEYGAEIRFRPVILSKLFENSGALPLAQRPKARQDYRFLELQRWRDKRGIPLNLRPRHFPTNPSLADRTVIALVRAGEDPGDYVESVGRACWADEEDIASREVIAGRLSRSGFDPERILAAAETPEVAAEYEANTAEAVRLNAIGSPTYVLNGEVFWGQDRLDFLEDALRSGRAPFRVPE